MGCGSSQEQKAIQAGRDLFGAAERGDEAGIERALAKRADVNWSEPGGDYTPLMSACWNRQSNAALLLIRKGARVNIANQEYGSTPLHMACFHGLTDVVNALLACEADFDATNKAGRTPVDDAKTRGHGEIVAILTEKRAAMFGFDLQASKKLFQAAQTGDLEGVKDAMAAGADPDFSEDASKYTSLMASLSCKHEAIACLLMDQGADINIANKRKGDTALHLACSSGLRRATQMLLDKGANSHASNKNGKVPLEVAREKGHTTIIELFEGSLEQSSGLAAGSRLPQHWTTPCSAFPTQGWMAVWLAEGSPIFENLKNVFVTDGSQLGKGRDVAEKGTYNSLKLKCAWRIENLNLWKRYDTERTIVHDEIQGRGFTLPSLTQRRELADVASRLPDTPDPNTNEVVLLHGMKPETVLTILQNGCNMRFSNGNFGQGTYLAEDAGKSDQYCTKDAGDDPNLEEMHTRLYRIGDHHVDHPGNVYYVVMVRCVMGYFVRTLSGDAKAQDMDFNSDVFATPDRRELATIPGVVPPVHYQSMVVEMGAAVKRYREFVQFHEARLYPEYLLAYQRGQDM